MTDRKLRILDPEKLDVDGYVVARGLLEPAADLGDLIAEYEALVATLVDEKHADQGATFQTQIASLMTQTDGQCAQALDISLPQQDVTEATPVHLGPAVFGLLRNARLLDAVETVIGPEILSNPVQHSRFKLPEDRLTDGTNSALTAATNWHQDLGVLLPEADDSLIISVWMPLVPVDEDNGCLLFIPGSHKRGLLRHESSRVNTGLPAEAVPGQQVAVPMMPGDVLFFHSTTIHSSLPNRSDRLRWSIDLRYSPTGEPTGRPQFPGFVARSRRAPESELHDHAVWVQSWHDARAALAAAPDAQFNRWEDK